MDQRRLEYFLAVAEELNFTRAANRLHATQSTLSAGVKSLESDLRIELFTRSTRSVRLTEAGLTFLPEARAALEALDRARAAVEPLSMGLRGTLTVGVLSGLTVVDVPALAGDFHRRHPGVQLRTVTSPRGTAGLLELIKVSRADVVFAGPHVRDDQLTRTAIRQYDLELVLPANHPLAGEEAVHLEDIGSETFVDMPEGFGQRQLVDEAFARADLSRRVLIEVSDITMVTQYVAHGLGLALLPTGLARPDEDAVITVPLAGTRLSWTLDLVTSATRAPTRALHAFLDLVPHHLRRDRAF